MTPDEIKALREQFRESQEAFGQRLGGVTGRTIRRYENGETHPQPWIERRLEELCNPKP